MLLFIPAEEASEGGREGGREGDGTDGGYDVAHAPAGCRRVVVPDARREIETQRIRRQEAGRKKMAMRHSSVPRALIAAALLALVVLSSVMFVAPALAEEEEESAVLALTSETYADAVGASKFHFVKFFAPWYVSEGDARARVVSRPPLVECAAFLVLRRSRVRRGPVGGGPDRSALASTFARARHRCGHCKKLAPTWGELAAAMKEKDVEIATVDCTVYKEICQENGVKGYPTLKMFFKGACASPPPPRRPALVDRTDERETRASSDPAGRRSRGRRPSAPTAARARACVRVGMQCAPSRATDAHGARARTGEEVETYKGARSMDALSSFVNGKLASM